jgi:flavodoxin
MKKLLGILMMIMMALPLSSNAQTKKVLVAYFSHTGENYAVGNITKGNTCIIAEMIAKETNGTLFEIKPVRHIPKLIKHVLNKLKQR